MSKSTELVSSTTAEPTPMPGGADGPGGRDLAKDDGTPSSSTPLYLYVFFAVLIIVVVSSATLMTRSIANRRRQRRLFDDSILRGTWYPIDYGGDLGVANTPYGGNFDLKPPKLWETFIGRERRTVGLTRTAAEYDWDWDSIRPLSVTTVKGLSSSKTAPSNADVTHRICRYLGTADVPPPLEPNIGSSNTNDTNFKMGTPEPQKVVVAALIVMPSRSRSSRATSTFPPPPTTFASGSSLTSATPLTDPALRSSSSPQHTNLPPEGVTEPLAHLEFGIVELVMR